MELLDRPTGIVIHHSATRDTNTLSYDAIKKWHTGHHGWEEIGYHVVLEEFADDVIICTGRGFQYRGAHTVGGNSMIGVAVVGDFDKKQPSPEMLTRLVGVLQGLLSFYPYLGVEDIYYHNDFSHKSCPGIMFPEKEMLLGLLED